jgi:hypothetical protein
MVSFVDTAVGVTGSREDKWTDFYEGNKNDGGPFQMLFETQATALAKRTKSHLSDVNKLTETVAGSDHGNMMLVPGTKGVMQLIHHGFACNTTTEFVLAFAHGNLGESTTFKSVDRSVMVRPAVTEGIAVPSLESMLGAETPDEFGTHEVEGNAILEEYPNHCLITPEVFATVKGSKRIDSNTLACRMIESFQLSVVDDDELSVEKEEEAAGLENVLALLWASSQGLLTEVRLEDAPENTMMNHLIKGVKDRLTGRDTNPGTSIAPPTITGSPSGDLTSSMELMVASSQSMVALLNKFQDGSEADRRRKESETSILKTMGPTQRDLFTSLCTRRMNVAPAMTSFMKSLATSKTPQKAFNLIQSETRDWEGTFSAGGFHRLLSHGFLSQDPNRSNPGGFTIFMFYPKTVDLGVKGEKGSNELLREYLGMDVSESTLEFYMKQGFYTPSSPTDLRIQLQTALDMLELLTCDGTIAGKGLAFILEPRSWARMSTVLNDRFKTEKDFGAKFCYTLDRHLQTFLNKMTKWEDIATDGQPRYLVNKAEELLERLEDGQGLNVMLPVALSGAMMPTASPERKRRSGAVAAVTPEHSGNKRKAATTSEHAAGDAEPGVVHANVATVDTWTLPAGTKYLDLFDAKMPGLKGWPILLDTRIPKKQNRAQKAPMCVRFQALGKCKQGCSLAHIAAHGMPDAARSKADALFRAAYTSS